MRSSAARQSGFSLIELAIVIVIIGLLVGGVLVGKSLIRNADLQTIITDAAQYKSAAKTFRDKYMALPGDFNEAINIWGDDNAACPNAGVTNGSPGTCNGNGDGGISHSASGAGATGENFEFWRQLMLEGLVKGQFSGLAGAGGLGSSVPGTNIPASRIINVGWGAQSVNHYAGDTAAYAMDYGNNIYVGATVTSSTTHNPFLTPKEAWNIDSKIDDGKPARGEIIARYWNDACAAADDGGSANNDLAASYRLSDSTRQCMLYFIKAF